MKTFRIIVLLLVLGINATAQENQNFAKILDTYVGTWVYQKNDTVFKIKFQKGQQLWTKKTANGLYGGYYLSVNGRVLEDYMGEQLLSPTKIRWKLDEEKGIWNETEGDESISDAGRRPIGFSVPDDVIMTKE